MESGRTDDSSGSPRPDGGSTVRVDTQETLEAVDERSNYEYAAGTVEQPALAAELRALIDGEVRFDRYSRQLYATDASIYEVEPVGVVFPTDTEDVSAVLTYCSSEGVAVLPRGAGTSLAGQAVNEAVVLDFTRHMDDALDVEPEAARARVQPGITLGELDQALATHGLHFAPDPAWADKSTLGGAIGNNSTGAHSLVYGKTDAYVQRCEVVLADGTVTSFGEVPIDELERRADPSGDLEARIYAEVARILDSEREAIETGFPDLKRNVSGYNLDRLLDTASEETVNLASLLCGSEGTLAVVTEAEVGLEPLPAEKSMALLAYEDLADALADVEPVLAHGPAAVEVLDDVLLDLARETEEFGALVDSLLPAETGAVLLVEFYVDSTAAGKATVADLLVDRVGDVTTEGIPAADAETTTDAPRRAIHAREAYEATERERFWKLRKSGLPILLSRTTDEKHIAFIEDAAVPPARLPEYVADLEAVLAEHDTSAAVYGHAGPGVLHVRPLLNTKTEIGVDRMESIAAEVTSLIAEYEGSVSGEHGDGRARTQWAEQRYGEHLTTVFRDLKSAFDPDWRLNPGQVVSRPDEPADMTDNLRFDPEYEFDAGFEPTLSWDIDNGMQGMVELCHGCGGCRGHQETTGGVMCPTYRASQEEITSTRGRANMLRAAMSGDLPEGIDVEFMHEVLDLCIGCKGCARDCPSEVDLAKLKAEVSHEYHQRHGHSLRDRLFANFDRLGALGSATAPVSNWLQRVPGAAWLLERTVGIASERELPTFAREPFEEWFDARTPTVTVEEADHAAMFVVDPDTNYSTPDIAKAAVEVLEAAGVHLTLASQTDTGRPAFSKGSLDVARDRARSLLDELDGAIAEDRAVIAVEPSDAVMIQSDYRDLLEDSRVDRVATRTYGVCEYLDEHDLSARLDVTPTSETLTYHGHCHQKANGTAAHAPAVLRATGNEVEVLDSGCCGMAGSFGYEAEHYAMSQAIGRILFEQVDGAEGDRVVAPGTSCRTQLSDHVGARPPHPVEILAEGLA